MIDSKVLFVYSYVGYSLQLLQLESPIALGSALLSSQASHFANPTSWPGRHSKVQTALHRMKMEFEPDTPRYMPWFIICYFVCVYIQYRMWVKIIVHV